MMRLDNRGSARRGIAFEHALHGQLGKVEVSDQVAGVKVLIDRGLVDSARVGVMGWSYGGYLSLLCLEQAPEVFHAACCGAPVTHWAGYAACYTERFLGMPDENRHGYLRSSALSHVANIADSARLMVLHGLLDENVHFRHTALLLEALTKYQKRHELLVFPKERHMPSEQSDRIYLEERIAEFFRSALLGDVQAKAASDGKVAVRDDDED